MGEHKRKKLKLKIAVMQGAERGLTLLAWSYIAFGLYASCDQNEAIHSILTAAIADGRPGWAAGLVVFMTFGVYGCAGYISLGLARLIQFRLKGHHLDEVVEGKSWE